MGSPGRSEPYNSMIRELVRRQPTLNRIRKFVRFVEAVPPTELLSSRARTAFRVRSNTLLDYPRLATIHEAAGAAPPGAFVECGVWAGGSAGMMSLAAPARHLWLFDSWQGLPEPGERDISVQGHRRPAGWNHAERAEVEQFLLGKLGLDPERVHLVQGWFDETLPTARPEIGPIALMHLDGDWYASIRTCLELLYDAVVPGGFVVVDDYFHWQGCAQAVNGFLAAHEPVELKRVGVAAWWRRGG